ncbi:MAG: mercury methylation corrinoid protein HgcA [Methanomassiliicoccus sp.]|nr:mercury methylation corrinoid protein HgcA [Methanomassiliicoccus sp.]
MLVSTELTSSDRWDHLRARVGYRRMEHLVVPGLYGVGAPSRASPVFVSANYTLSFDALRVALHDIDAFILVLDTKGVNVWCAAGKGSFGTDELISKIGSSGLAERVDHRRLILPQLGAPGVAAHVVKRATGFTVEYGPVRAGDIPEYLRLGRVTPEMRRVAFPLRDRAVLVPVEVVQSLKYLLPAMAVLLLVGGTGSMLIAVAAVLGGTALFPLLLPYLPTKDFSSKGLILGIAISLPFSCVHALDGHPLWGDMAYGVAIALLVAPVVGYLGLNFTGCSTSTSRTGVRKEIFRWVPIMVVMVVAGAVLMAAVISGEMGWW